MSAEDDMAMNVSTPILVSSWRFMFPQRREDSIQFCTSLGINLESFDVIFNKISSPCFPKPGSKYKYFLNKLLCYILRILLFEN